MKSKTKQKTIAGRIIRAMTSVTIGALAIATVTAVAAIYISATRLTEQSFNETAELAAARVQWELQSMLNISIEMGADSQMSSIGFSKEQRQARVDEAVKIFGLDRGTIIAADGTATNGNSYSDREYFQRALEGQTTITEPLIGKTTGELSTIIAAPLWKNGEIGGTVDGCVYIVPDTEFMNDIVRDINVSANGKSGKIIAHPDTQSAKNQINVQELAEKDPTYASLAEQHAKMVDGNSGFGTFSNAGIDYFIGYAPIEGTDGWTVVITAPKDDFTGTANDSFLVLCIISIAAAILAVITATLIGKRIGAPIKLCAQRIEKLAEGDLTSEVPVINTKDETKILARSTQAVVEEQKKMINDIGYILSSMAEGNFAVDSADAKNLYKGDYKVLIDAVIDINRKLNDTLTQINIAGDQISSGSEQVSAGAQSLAQGATEQAASVEELAGAIHNISDRIEATANECRNGNELVNETSEYFEAANEKMHSLTKAMQEINDASTEIGKIIQTIEDIAFQTNILALNAAVEAARVGEAGKGFAVVADEVRNLAGKSAEAAHDTTVLIERAVQAVENGSNITLETADAVNQVEARLDGVSNVVKKIAAASNEQADMVKQVNTGVEQISNVVQTNSATAEEGAAASEELSAQALMLQKLVGSFTFREGE